MKTNTKKTGTKEWSERSYNICRGCSNECRYCYAREMAVVRYKTISADDWPLMRVDQVKVDKPIAFKRGVWMFPTTHDITPANLSEFMCVLRKMVEAGNQVLVVSKPRLECIRPICEAFEEFRGLIQFRFTIGSMDDAVLGFWEPNAPTFGERLDCLKYAFDMGYVTSVSCEPFLDDKTYPTYLACRDFISDSFWIGRLNKFDQRVNLSSVVTYELHRFVDFLKELQSDAYCRQLYLAMKDKLFIRWKDSFRDIIESMKI